MLKCLQAGRGIAALAVVAFHLSVNFGDPRYGVQPLAGGLSQYGYLGVDFFFVLSGFIILNAHLKDVGRPHRWRTYIWRRFVRVYPIYWIYLTIMCALLLLGAARTIQPPHDLAAWFSAYSLVKTSSETPPLLVAWTLFHEIAFYFAFSTLILNRWLGLALLCAWAAACAVMFHYTGAGGDSALAVYTSAFNLEFFMGMGAYALYRHNKYPVLLLAAGAAVIIAVVATARGVVDHDIFGIGCALLIAGATILEARGRLATPAALVLLGGGSYTIYLVHVPIEDTIMRFADLGGLSKIVPSPVIWWGILLVTVALAYAAWFVIERPLQAALGRLERSALALLSTSTA